jgi:rhomboid protease GluP
VDSAVFIFILITSATVGFRLMQQKGERFRWPFATLGIAAVTLVVSVLAEFDPVLLAGLGRDRDALLAGEWWRMVTPLFAQDGGWPGLIFNLVSLLVLGTAVELTFGRGMLLAVYFAAGLVSEVAAYTVLQGQGFAGNSVANFGLAGFVAVIGVFTGSMPRLFGVLSLIGGMVLVVTANLHGVGYLVGALIGVAYGLKTRPRRSVSRVAPGSPGESSAGS